MRDTTITHPELVRAISKPGQEIVSQLTPEDAELWHMGTGCATEAGELLDAIKKKAIYRRALDLENVIEELGDLEFFMERIRQLVGVSRETCIEYNIRKLTERYAGLKYTNEDAVARKDKQGA